MMQINQRKSDSGFTLIELLVVIAIISLLASVIMATLNGARESARDAARVASFNQVELALEMYYNRYGQYPCGDAGYTAWQDGVAHSIDTSLSDGWIDGVDGATGPCPTGPFAGLDDIGAWPEDILKDPINDEWDGSFNNVEYYYTYLVRMNRQNYIIYALFETSDVAENDGGVCDNYYEVGPGVGEMHIYDDQNKFNVVTCEQSQ